MNITSTTYWGLRSGALLHCVRAPIFQILLNGEWKENLFIYMKRLQNIWRDLTDLVRKELMGLEAKHIQDSEYPHQCFVENLQFE